MFQLPGSMIHINTDTGILESRQEIFHIAVTRNRASVVDDSAFTGREAPLRASLMPQETCGKVIPTMQFRVGCFDADQCPKIRKAYK